MWADTVDEVATVLHPRQVRLERVQVPPAPIALVADDVDRSWILDAARTGDAVVTVTGSARSLALLAWGRPTDEPVVTGDRDALDAALAARSDPLTQASRVICTVTDVSWVPAPAKIPRSGGTSS